MQTTFASPEARRDLAACKALLARGSKSFALAALLLPPRIREATAAVYAFCRVADDLIDDQPEHAPAALDELVSRLDGIFAQTPIDSPVDRSLCRVVNAYRMPRAPFDALIDGFRWDVLEREYESLSDVLSYGARVAGSVGVIMTYLMGPRDRRVLARACELGVAMQLTNIARDVGEDARRGRIYLPAAWLREVDLDIPTWRSAPASHPGVQTVVRRLVLEAEKLYERAELGIPMLPRRCRLAIRAARLIYADIHRTLRERDYDSVSSRSVVPTWRKLWLLVRALGAYFYRSRAPSDRDPEPLAETELLLPARAA